MRMPAFLAAALALAAIVAGCALAYATRSASEAGPPARQVTVFAAASLAEAFSDAAERFEREHPGVRVTLNLAGSHRLAQQLSLGAPADLFASASEKHMEIVIEAGRVAGDAPQLFAHNRLAVVYAKSHAGALQRLEDLAQPGLRLVLVAKEAPAGQYALQFLERASADSALGATYEERVLGNVVSYEENVKAVLSKVALGEADAGIVYVTDVTSADPARVGRLSIPQGWNVLSPYFIAPLQDGAETELAQAFMQLLMSPAGQSLLAQHGFQSVLSTP